MGKKPFYTVLYASTWQEFIAQSAELGDDWVFRGESSDWSLRTSLDRARERAGVEPEKAPEAERKLLREFSRRYHLYSPQPPRDNELLEWLAVMQHHGAPTRLLDWTYSPFVAAFFAFEKAERTKTTNGDCFVWAIDVTALKRRFKRRRPRAFAAWNAYAHKRDGKAFRKLLLQKRHTTFVCPVCPIRMNERLAIQQGLFLCPGDITQTFEQNIEALSPSKPFVRRITISIAARNEALLRLYRMNLSRASLFPDLDGFATSLWTRLRHLTELPDAWGGSP